MRIAEVVESEMGYSARTWNRELATRYVLELDGRLVEFSHFRHFLDDLYVKDVIEVASSFGCTVGCHHCAAADLPSMQSLTAAEIEACTRLIASRHGLTSSSRVLITYSGIGEASLLRTSMFASAQNLQKSFANAEFVMTTVGIRPEFLASVTALAQRVRLKYLQVSIFSADATAVRAMMPLGDRLGYDPARLVDAMVAEQDIRYRLNYVVIDGLNSTPKQAAATLDAFDAVRDRSVLRVSRLNETAASQRNGLKQPSIDAVHRVVEAAVARGWDAYEFFSFGNDRLNCGQLAGSYLVNVGMPRMRGMTSVAQPR